MKKLKTFLLCPLPGISCNDNQKYYYIGMRYAIQVMLMLVKYIN